ncbi:MAG: DNA polymerase I [Chloroflexi bacterium]|nr:DNA polymerase I [Chloroflexota bacterium]
MTTAAGAAPLLEQDGSPLLILIDGHALVHRAHHAMRDPLTVQSTGEVVSGVYGFMNMFLRALEEWKPSHCIVTFDVSAPTFRHEAFEEYKAQRPPTPPELRPQFGRVKQFMEAFNVPVFEMAGFEADDILGTLGTQAEEQHIDTLIVTGDSDILQLVTPSVRVLLDSGRQRASAYDIARVKERYEGLGPEYVAEIKALEGDKSDNIPGLPGVGRKTAIRLLDEYGSIEGIYENIDEVSSLKLRGAQKIQNTLRENEELALQCKMLTTIRRDVPVTLELDAARFGGFRHSNVLGLMRELEFFSMTNRIPSAGGEGEQLGMMGMGDEERVPTEYVVVDTEAALEEMVRSLEASEFVAFDTETTSQTAMLAELVGLSFSNEDGKGWYVPVGHEEGQQLGREDVIERLKPLLESGDVALAAHNANYDMTVLGNYGIDVEIAFDTMIAAHLCGRTRTSVGLKPLALSMLKEDMTPIKELIGRGRNQTTMDKVEIAKAADYAAADADMTFRLIDVFANELEENNLRHTFDTLEMPLVPVLVKMQRDGVAIDTGALAPMSVDMGEQIGAITESMYETVGHEFNINSPRQLGDVLFNELYLPPTRKTPSGGFTTNAAALEGLKEFLDSGNAEGVDPKAYQVLDMVLEYRQLTKLKSTYVDALPTLVNPNTGRIHTEFKQTGSDTGRLSSTEPNVQNIPVRTELGRRVRSAFVAEDEDWTLLAADYSQIELRILAHYSRDEGLMSAFRNGEDIHAATAASVYGVGIGDVDAEMRRVAKIMNFGVLYGLSPFGIRQQTGFSAEEGKAFIDSYFTNYPGIQSYIDGIKEQVRADGYVETLMGRRRRISEIHSRSYHTRAAGERMAVNMPIQGTAADIIKIAMINIEQRMAELGMRSRMILQVHDELIFEVPRNELEQMRAIVTELMPSAVPPAVGFEVPLEVEMKVGDNWGEME